MAAELLGAKLLAPFFGSSLYVWSSVMAVTLLGLAIGYFIGGIMSSKEHIEKRLYKILVLGAAIIALMPFTAQFCFALFSTLNLLPSVILSSIVLLVPPVLFMGMVSPFVIAIINQFIQHPGKSSGLVYAISTVGGILTTFGVGFYIIPHFGLTKPCIGVAVMLGIVPSVMLLMKKNLMAAVLVLAISFSIKAAEVNKGSSRIKVLALKEGVLGQLLVVDYPNDYYYGDSTKKGTYSRWLFVNRISQTMYDPHADTSKGEEAYFTYLYTIKSMTDTIDFKKKTMLQLGLGGGVIPNYFHKIGFKVDVCELDKRIHDIAIDYFDFNRSIPVTIDDARHFINTCEKKYDIIVFDTFKGEETPSHIFTMQSLNKVKQMLNPGGIVIVNTFGYWKGKSGRGAKSIYKTFQAAGYSTLAIPTSEDENQRNIEFFASPTRHLNPNKNCIAVNQSELKEACVLTDELPNFEKINALAGLNWRRAAIQTFLYDSLQKKIPFFQ